MIQISKILKEVPIFKMLGKESIDFIVERLKFKTFDKDELISVDQMVMVNRLLLLWDRAIILEKWLC